MLILPIGFDAPTRRPPIATYVLAAVCTVTWIFSTDPFAQAWSMELVAWPAGVENFRAFLAERYSPEAAEAAQVWYSRPWTLLTCTFLHGGFMHLMGNVAFLVTFGRAVNGWLGTVRFLALYVLLAVLSSLGHLALGAGGGGLVGASGAISGVMGLAAAFFPRRRIRFFYWFYYRLGTFRARAFWALLLWFGWDLVKEVFFRAAGVQAGVAFMAHVMGFLAGFGVGVLMLKTELAERHDGDFFGWLVGLALKQERAPLREYVAALQAEREAEATLEDYLKERPPEAPATPRPGPRPLTARFTPEAPEAPPRRVTLGSRATEALLAAAHTPHRRGEALELYREMLDRSPLDRLPLEAEGAAANIAHLVGEPEVEVTAVERLARRYPSAAETERLTRRAAEVCRRALGDEQRAQRLMRLLD